MHEKITEIIEIRKQKETEWTKTSLTILSTMLGLIVAFSNSKSDNPLLLILFSLTIILFGLSIICGLLLLYRDTQILKNMVKDYLKNSNNLEQPLTAAVITYEPRLFIFSRKIYYVLLASSVMSLCSYAIVFKMN